MVNYVSPEIYRTYKKKVLEMSPAIQNYIGTTQVRESSSLSDQEIADRLGLDVDTVTEIRCIAEIDLFPADAWLDATNWKRDKARKTLRIKKQ